MVSKAVFKNWESVYMFKQHEGVLKREIKNVFLQDLLSISYYYFMQVALSIKKMLYPPNPACITWLFYPLSPPPPLPPMAAHEQYASNYALKMRNATT